MLSELNPTQWCQLPPQLKYFSVIQFLKDQKYLLWLYLNYAIIDV